MFCPKCGAENENESAFCTSCGTPLKRFEATSPVLVTARPIVSAGDTNGSTAYKKLNGKKVGLIVALVVAVALIVLAVTTCSKGDAKLLEGEYKAEISSSSSYKTSLSFVIGPEDQITLSSKVTSGSSGTKENSFTGRYERDASVDGNDVYTIKDIKLSNGQYATSSDLGKVFGGYTSSDYTIDAITMILPQDCEDGKIEGRWGFVLSAKISSGETGIVGAVAIVNGDDTGATCSINTSGYDITPADALTDTGLSSYSGQTFKIVNNAPGRYTLTYDEYGNSIDLTIPVKK